MSSVLCVQPVTFGSDPRIKDNAFIANARVSAAQAESDQAVAFHLLEDLRKRIRHEGMPTYLLRNTDDRRGSVVYADQGDAIFPNNSISFHNFTDADGQITRRVVILYPMSPYRQHELPQVQLLDKLVRAAEEGLIELVDLRGFQEEGRALEGTGAINFSHDGRFAFMSRSTRSDDAIFDIVCGPENLNIPPQNRFVFASATPRKDGGSDTIYHTNVVGWCGKGICAWALDLLIFDSEADRERFYKHLEAEYAAVVDLSAAEVAGFSGNALELAARAEDGTDHRFLCLSAAAHKALSVKNRRALEEWYGAEDLLVFYAEAVERRTGGSVRCMLGASITHGSVIPAKGQHTIFEVVGVEERH